MSYMANTKECASLLIAFTAQFPALFLILDAHVGSEMAWGKEGNEGTSAWVNSIMILPSFHYLCLNFMLFKLFMRTEGCFELFIILEWILEPVWLVKMLCWVYISCERNSIPLSSNLMNYKPVTSSVTGCVDLCDLFFTRTDPLSNNTNSHIVSWNIVRKLFHNLLILLPNWC